MANKLSFFSKYFQEGLHETVEKCCSRLELEYYRPNQTVFEIGDIGDKFYLILEGEVEVLARMPEIRRVVRKNDEAALEAKQPPKNKYLFDPNEFVFDENDEGRKNRMMTVKTLREGEAFGEIALLYSKPRLATIRTTKKCIFGVLDKASFREILRERELEQIASMAQQLLEIPLFSTWSLDSRRDIYLYIEKVQMKSGEVVFSKGDHADKVFIIHSGEFSIRKSYSDVTHHLKSQNKQSAKSTTPKIKKKRNSESPERALLKVPAQTEKIFTVLKMCKNEVFGEENILRKENRTYTVECSSFEAELLVIKDTHFLSRVYERNEESKEFILNSLNNKCISITKNEENLQKQIEKFTNYFLESKRISPKSQSDGLTNNSTLGSRVTSPTLPKLSPHRLVQDVNNTTSNSRLGRTEESPNRGGQQQHSHHNENLFRRQNQLIFPLVLDNSKRNALNFYANDADKNMRRSNENFMIPNKSSNNQINTDSKSGRNSRQQTLSPRQRSSSEDSSNKVKGFFDFELSVQEKMKIMGKYEYKNYLNSSTISSENKSESKPDRFMIPIRKLVFKVFNMKTPLLTDFEKDLLKMQQERFYGMDSQTSPPSNSPNNFQQYNGKNQNQQAYSLNDVKTRSSSVSSECHSPEETLTYDKVKESPQSESKYSQGRFPLKRIVLKGKFQMKDVKENKEIKYLDSLTVSPIQVRNTKEIQEKQMRYIQS